MDYLIGFLLVLQVLICLLLILIVLMQRPRQEGLGAAFGSGTMDQAFGAQTTNVLQKSTTWLGILRHHLRAGGAGGSQGRLAGQSPVFD